MSKNTKKKQPSIKPEKQNNTCFGTYVYSFGTHHGNLLKSLSVATYFLLRVQSS